MHCGYPSTLVQPALTHACQVNFITISLLPHTSLLTTSSPPFFLHLYPISLSDPLQAFCHLQLDPITLPVFFNAPLLSTKCTCNLCYVLACSSLPCSIPIYSRSFPLLQTLMSQSVHSFISNINFLAGANQNIF